jgi:hypothetical protein
LVRLAIIFGAALHVNVAASQGQSIDEDRALVARDICVGIAAKFAHAPGGKISFEAGRFRVTDADGTLTVFEGSVPVARIPDFSFTEFVKCIKDFYSAFENARKQNEAGARLEAFSAGYELSDALTIGVCARSAAMGGFYIGDVQNDNVPLQKERVSQLVLALSKSAERRLSNLSRRPITFELAGKLKFYNFYQDRFVPYFDTEAIFTSLESFNDAMPATPREYGSLGLVVGRMKRTFLYSIEFSFVLRSVQTVFDDRANRARAFLPASLQCLARAYNEDMHRLRDAMDELGISTIERIPDLSTAYSMGTDGQYLFERTVTQKIRHFLKLSH